MKIYNREYHLNFKGFHVKITKMNTLELYSKIYSVNPLAILKFHHIEIKKFKMNLILYNEFNKVISTIYYTQQICDMRE